MPDPDDAMPDESRTTQRLRADGIRHDEQLSRPIGDERTRDLGDGRVRLRLKRVHLDGRRVRNALEDPLGVDGAAKLELRLGDHELRFVALRAVRISRHEVGEGALGFVDTFELVEAPGAREQRGCGERRALADGGR